MANNINRKHQRSKKEWAVLIKKFHVSGLTRKEFCEQNNLSSEYFYRIVRDSLKKFNSLNQSLKSEPSFIPIELSCASDKTSPNVKKDQSFLVRIESTIKINFANGISVEFENGCSGLELTIIKDWLYANK